MADRWCYSRDEERFEGDCASREDALAEATAEYGADLDPGEVLTVWTGRSVPFEVPDHTIRSWHVMERLSEIASEDVGEVAEDWPSAKHDPAADAELETALGEVIRAWVAKHDPPNFWKVTEVKKHEVRRG